VGSGTVCVPNRSLDVAAEAPKASLDRRWRLGGPIESAAGA
jgi:hypothetical protein